MSKNKKRQAKRKANKDIPTELHKYDLRKKVPGSDGGITLVAEIRADLVGAWSP